MKKSNPKRDEECDFRGSYAGSDSRMSAVIYNFGYYRSKFKEALAESCDHQPFIAKAPMVLVFCADCKKWYDAYLEAGCKPRKPDVGDLMLAVTDTAIAAQNAVVAAESFGIGSCYIGDIMENCEEQKTLTIARICISGSYDSIWLAYKATNEA